MSNDQRQSITRVVEGWTVDVTADEPRVRDIDMAERSGLRQPRDIRKLIQRSRQELEEFGPLVQRVHRTRYESKPGKWQEREVAEFWLTEHQALAVLLQLRTPLARRARASMVRMFIAYHRGELPVPQQVPVLSTSPLVGDSRVHRAEMVSWCELAAHRAHVSVHRIHGELRRQCRSPSVYQIPLVLFPQARELLEAIAHGRLMLPPRAVRRLALVADPAQGVLPFPGAQRT